MFTNSKQMTTMIPCVIYHHKFDKSPNNLEIIRLCIDKAQYKDIHEIEQHYFKLLEDARCNFALEKDKIKKNMNLFIEATSRTLYICKKIVRIDYFHDDKWQSLQ